LLVLLALSGCMRVERELRLNRDGTGSYTLTLGFREPKPGDASSLSDNIVTPMEAFGAHVQQQGGTSRRYDDQTYVYCTFTRSFPSIAQADPLLQDDPRAYDQNHAPLLFHDTLHVSVQSGPFATTFHVTGVISLVDAAGNATNWQDAMESVTITMPDGISAHKGGAHQGNSVNYTIHYNEAVTVDVTGGAGGATGAGLAVLAVALAGVALALAGLGLWLVRGAVRKRARVL